MHSFISVTEHSKLNRKEYLSGTDNSQVWKGSTTAHYKLLKNSIKKKKKEKKKTYGRKFLTSSVISYINVLTDKWIFMILLTPAAYCPFLYVTLQMYYNSSPISQSDSINCRFILIPSRDSWPSAQKWGKG